MWANGHEALSVSLAPREARCSRYLDAVVACSKWALAQRLADKWASRRWGRLLFSHAVSAFSAEDVGRFLGRKLCPALAAEVASDARCRPEGWRPKHRMGRNSVKCHDKANVARVEVTINDPTWSRVLWVKNGHRVWCPMQKGVANLPRYYQVGRAEGERYLEALSAATDYRDGVRVLERHCRPITNRGKRHPRLNPVAKEDLALFPAALAGEHLVNGFSNRHLQARLYRKPPADLAEAKRRRQRTSRLVRKLRGHGLVARSLAAAFTASPPTASASWPPPSPRTAPRSPTPTSISSSRPEAPSLLQHSRGGRKSCGGVIQRGGTARGTTEQPGLCTPEQVVSFTAGCPRLLWGE